MSNCYSLGVRIVIATKVRGCCELLHASAGQAKAGSVVKWRWFVQVRAGQGRQCGKVAVVRSGSGRPRPAVW